MRNDELARTHCFRLEDEPNARGLSRAEVEEYNRQLLEGHWAFASSEEVRHRESRLECSSITRCREEEKVLLDKLASLREDIPFYKPRLVALSSRAPTPEA